MRLNIPDHPIAAVVAGLFVAVVLVLKIREVAYQPHPRWYGFLSSILLLAAVITVVLYLRR